MESLAQSVPGQQTIWSESVAKAAKTCFAILNDRQGECRQWARDFVLAYDSDPAGDAMALTNGSAVRYSCGGHFTYGSNGLSTAGCDILHLLVPSWCQNGVTVGVCVEYGVGTSAANEIVQPSLPAKGEATQSIGRFIQEKNGEILIISSFSSAASASNPQCAAVLHTVNKSPSDFSTTFFLCDHKMLRGKYKTPEMFAASTVMCQFFPSELSTCPVCLRETGDSEQCYCKLPVVPTTRSLDFTEFRRRAMVNRGNAKSTLNSLHRLSCNLPFALNTSPMLTTTKTPFEDDIAVSLSERLCTLGIEGRMRLGRVQGPVAALEMPGNIARVSGRSEIMQTVGSAGNFRNMSSSDDLVCMPGRLSSPPDGHDRDEDSGGREQRQKPSQIPPLGGTVFAEPEEPSVLMNEAAAYPLFPSIDIAPVEAPPLDGRVCSPSEAPLDYAAGVVHGREETATLENEAIRGEPNAGRSDEKEAASLELRRKRIERNRLSAARSNLRKREEREELRRSIEHWKEKVAELEEREKEYGLCLVLLAHLSTRSLKSFANGSSVECAESETGTLSPNKVLS